MSTRRYLPVVGSVLHQMAPRRERFKQLVADVDIKLVISKNPQPRLVLSKAIKIDSKKVKSVSLFSATSKMNCASYSLPAGPPTMGGTCPSAATVPDRVKDGEQWVCHSCYALHARFRFGTIQVYQAIRLAWTKEAIKRGTFVNDMVTAIERYRSAPCAGDEFLNPAFFRIHDSGDFFSTEYAQAWFEIAKRLPSMFFWAPTREWIFPKKLPSLVNAPPNLAIRPSAMIIDELPPDIDGMAAGSSVMRKPPDSIHNCPVYKSKDKSCETAGCRACWTYQTVYVNYKPHGAVKKPKIVKNPAIKLVDYWSKHLARRDINPEIKNFWMTLNAENLSCEDFAEADWYALFASQGIIDDDEQIAILESIAIDLF